MRSNLHRGSGLDDPLGGEKGDPSTNQPLPHFLNAENDQRCGNDYWPHSPVNGCCGEEPVKDRYIDD